MLRVLKDMGAQPLLLGRPQKADYLLAIGVSTAVLPAYYARLHQVAQPYDFPVVDMAEHQNDHYFSVDTVPHTSRLGWVYVDQILDEFYHGNLR
jgi:poly-D-alanine transfer protein DltD